MGDPYEVNDQEFEAEYHDEWYGGWPKYTKA
jgi:hypothetical protein